MHAPTHESELNRGGLLDGTLQTEQSDGSVVDVSLDVQGQSGGASNPRQRPAPIG